MFVRAETRRRRERFLLRVSASLREAIKYCVPEIGDAFCHPGPSDFAQDRLAPLLVSCGTIPRWVPAFAGMTENLSVSAPLREAIKYCLPEMVWSPKLCRDFSQGWRLIDRPNLSSATLHSNTRPVAF